MRRKGRVAMESKEADREKREVIGYYTEDENIYCTECIRKNIEVMKRVERAITADGKDGVYLCDGCGKEIRRKSTAG